MNHPLIITPRTKVAALLEAYPQLESMLIEAAPAFEKLKNPLLRKTVARITTLQQAAAIGNVNVEELVNRLRKEVGQDVLGEAEKAAGLHLNYQGPEWFSENKVVKRLDARPLLHAGEMPAHQIMDELKHLGSKQVFELTAPLLTIPIIEKAAGLEVKHWIEKKSEDEFVIRFYR